MIYLYPKLSEKDYFIFRNGGAGLGNILFTYARAVVYASKHPGTKMIWPTWLSLKIGPILRNEKDKRFYSDLFSNHSGYISGFEKFKLLAIKEKASEQDLLQGVDCNNKIVEFTGFDECFTPIMADSEIVRADIIKNLKSKNQSALYYNFKGICIHIRLGDFSRVTMEDVLSGKHNSAIPVEWYANMIREIRKITGKEIPVHIFSDGSDDELAEVLSLPQVSRKSFGTAIADIIALSNAKLLVASGSSFSMWARYLGRMTTILFPNQVKQNILFPEEKNKEIVAFEYIPEEYNDLVCNIFKDK